MELRPSVRLVVVLNMTWWTPDLGAVANPPRQSSPP